MELVDDPTNRDNVIRLADPVLWQATSEPWSAVRERGRVPMQDAASALSIAS